MVCRRAYRDTLCLLQPTQCTLSSYARGIYYASSSHPFPWCVRPNQRRAPAHPPRFRLGLRGVEESSDRARTCDLVRTTRDTTREPATPAIYSMSRGSGGWWLLITSRTCERCELDGTVKTSRHARHPPTQAFATDALSSDGHERGEQLMAITMR